MEHIKKYSNSWPEFFCSLKEVLSIVVRGLCANIFEIRYFLLQRTNHKPTFKCMRKKTEIQLHVNTL